MPGFNLVRNAKVFFTNKLTNGVIQQGSLLAADTYELQVMNGFSFSQNTETQNITVSEAGLDPARGQRTFNTALAPVDFSFTTYIRPRNNSGITCEEKVLWNALFSDNAIDSTGLTIGTVSAFTRTANADTITFTCAAANLAGAGIAVGDVVTLSGITDTTDTTGWNTPVKITAATPSTSAATSITIKYLQAPKGATTAPSSAPTTFKFHKSAVVPQSGYLLATSGRSNKNQLVSFGLIVIFDDQTYLIDNCSLNQASVDFGLDGIAQVAWTGQGTALRQLSASTAASGTFGGTLTGTYTQADTAANFITNKLTTASLLSNLRGISGTSYVLAITGGNLTINNNITYVTPEIMGKVNEPIGYFTGTRAISGNLTAYLKTGSTNTAGLLSTIVAAAKAPGGSENKYSLGLQIGGSTNPTKVEVDLPGVMLQIPTVETQDVVSTTINFTAQGFVADTSAAAGGTANYDLEATNDITLRYYSA